MSSRIEEIAVKLAESGQETAALFRSLDADALNTPVHSEGDSPWRARDLLAHFVSIERSMHALFNNMLAGGSGDDGSFDVDRFNRGQVAKLAETGVEDLIAQFESVRGETVRLVRSMQESDLDREGRHPWHGAGRLERFIRWAYEHAALHQAELQATLAGIRGMRNHDGRSQR
jgi:hypothetical protein